MGEKTRQSRELNLEEKQGLSSNSTYHQTIKVNHIVNKL